MKRRNMMALFLVSAMTVSAFAGSTSVWAEEAKEYSEDEIIDFSMFIAMPGSEKNDGNEVKEIIAKKVGARVEETWLTGQTAAEAVGTIIASGEYPDFIDGGDAMMQLYDAGALVPWDEYLPLEEQNNFYIGKYEDKQASNVFATRNGLCIYKG